MIPTSNHNTLCFVTYSAALYIFWFLHQTTTMARTRKDNKELYIFWFLHQTTTILVGHWKMVRCISFDSYIKPQQADMKSQAKEVVYLLIPTSNHNIPLSSMEYNLVVYLLIPTSNHNQYKTIRFVVLLYIFWFLHQTTTAYSHTQNINMLYIFWFLHQTTTEWLHRKNIVWLYIFWFLHQTTTITHCF